VVISLKPFDYLVEFSDYHAVIHDPVSQYEVLFELNTTQVVLRGEAVELPSQLSLKPSLDEVPFVLWLDHVCEDVVEHDGVGIPDSFVKVQVDHRMIQIVSLEEAGVPFGCKSPKLAERLVALQLDVAWSCQLWWRVTA